MPEVEVITGVFVAACLLAATASAVQPQPNTLEELQLFYPNVDDHANAALVYLKAVELRKIGFDRDLPLIGGGKPLAVPVTPLGLKIKAGFAKELDNNTDTLLLLHQACGMDECRYPIDLTRGESTGLAHLAKMRDLARLLYVQAVVAADDGRAALAVQSLLDSMALARSLRREPLSISQLVRIACWGIALDALEQVVNRVPLDGLMLSSLQSAVGRADDREAITRAIQGELCTWLDVDIETPEEKAARMAERAALSEAAAARGMGTMMPGGDLEEGVRDAETPQEGAETEPGSDGAKGRDKEDAPVSYRRRVTAEVQQQVVRDMTRLLGQCTLPYAEFFRENTVLLAMTRTRPSMPGQEAFTAATQVRVMVSAARMAARAATAQGALAVERYCAATGKLPDNWQELVPDYAPAALTDPFSLGAPLVYRRTEGGYVVYSIGQNGKDDGGTQGDGHPPLDHVFRVERAARR